MEKRTILLKKSQKKIVWTKKYNMVSRQIFKTCVFKRKMGGGGDK